MKNNIVTSLKSYNSYNKSIVATLALATAFAGQAMASDTTSPMSVEIGAGWNVAQKSILNTGDECPKLDTYGVDVTGVYALDKNNALTLRIGVSQGSKDNNLSFGEDNGDGYWWRSTEHNKYSVDTYAITVGYRYTGEITESLSGFVGANIGIASSKIKCEFGGTNTWAGGEGGDAYGDSKSESAIGLAYSIEAGVTYKVSSTVNIFVAYQISGNSAAPKFTETAYGWDPDAGEEYSYETEWAKGKSQIYHGIRAGVSVQF